MNNANIYFVALDWTISLGIGLITFASLETTGIYFGLGKCPCSSSCVPVLRTRSHSCHRAINPWGSIFHNSPRNSPPTSPSYRGLQTSSLNATEGSGWLIFPSQWSQDPESPLSAAMAECCIAMTTCNFSSKAHLPRSTGYDVHSGCHAFPWDWGWARGRTWMAAATENIKTWAFWQSLGMMYESCHQQQVIAPQPRTRLLCNLMLTWWEVVDGSLMTQSDLCY